MTMSDLTAKGKALQEQGLKQCQEANYGDRAAEIDNLLKAVQAHLIPFIKRADEEHSSHDHSSTKADRPDDIATSLVDPKTPSELASLLPSSFPTKSQGASCLLSCLEFILKYSVNTFAPGFLDKLYAATNAPGLASDLVLSALNTNVHVYQVSPVLTLIEKRTTKALAALFGLNGPRSGGISVQGGSASNMTGIVIARNTLYPDTKIYGNASHGRRLVMLTSAHGHYSIEKAAQALGFGSAAVIAVPVSRATGAMDSVALERAIETAKEEGNTPFYVNATAGSTVLGSFDPFPEISRIARKHNLWFHIDASWGGPFVYSPKLKYRLTGSELADTVAVNPHKMMGVPLTCSFLLAKDLRQFHRANTLPAGYLFHGEDPEDSLPASHDGQDDGDSWTEPNDLADLTLQCGRRCDSLKLFLSWQYYGSEGYARQMEHAHDMAIYFAELVARNPDLVLVSENPPPCLQVCFYYAPGRKSVFGSEKGQFRATSMSIHRHPGTHQLQDGDAAKANSLVTERIAKALVPRGFMIDFAPALEGREAEGKFFRVVVNVSTNRGTIEKLVDVITRVGWEVLGDLERKSVARHEENHVDGDV